MEDAYIKEAYVPFKTAKLLREKGFEGDGTDSECHMFYSDYTEGICPVTEIALVPDRDVYFAPTVQMAVEYIEKKGYCIIATPYTTPEKLLWCCEVKELRVIGDFLTLANVYCEPALTSRNEAMNKGVEHVLENLI